MTPAGGIAVKMNLLDLPSCMLEQIFENLSYDEVAKHRLVIKIRLMSINESQFPIYSNAPPRVLPAGIHGHRQDLPERVDQGLPQGVSAARPAHAEYQEPIAEARERTEVSLVQLFSTYLPAPPLLH